MKPGAWIKDAHNALGLVSAVFLVALLATGVALNHPEALVPGSSAKPLSVAADPRDSSRLLRGTAAALERSADGGRTWEEVPMLFPALEVVSIAFQPGRPDTVAVLQRWHGPLLSFDGGRVWEAVELPFDPQATGIELRSLSLGPDGSLHVLTSSGLLRRSGGRWTPVDFDAARRDWDRIVRTLHNGHFFGTWFVKVYDAAAAALLLLILTGVVLWRVKSS